MHSHQKPKFQFTVSGTSEIKKLEKHKKHRGIPEKSDDKLLIATWNLTNFGLQKRQAKHLKIMANIIESFDLIAVQEIADDLTHFYKMMDYLGSNWDFVVTDIAGNKERLGYIFDKTKLKPIGMVAELAMRGYERKSVYIEINGETEKTTFDGFNRNPYIVTFAANEFVFTAVNVHLYWSNYNLRKLETVALSKWAKKRTTAKFPPNDDIILLGDFNMPKLSEDDDLYNILNDNGLKVPKYNTELIGSNLAGDKHYDEVAFFPSRTGDDFAGKIGVFDFDKVLFHSLWDDNDKEKQKMFYQYIRYYIADHRPLWAEFYI